MVAPKQTLTHFKIMAEKIVEEIKSPFTTYRIILLPQGAYGKKKRYFEAYAINGGYLNRYTSTYARVKKKVEERLAYDLWYKKEIHDKYDVKGVLSMDDVSADLFQIESELEDPFKIKSKHGLVFERMNRECGER